MADAAREIAKSLQLARDLRLVALDVRHLAAKAAVFYANGGPGVGEPVVGDRFMGQGNARFAPLSREYGDWKSGKSKALNDQQKVLFGRGSRLIKEKTGEKVVPTYEHKLLREEALKRAQSGGTYASWFQKLKKDWKLETLHETKVTTRGSLPILVLTGALRAAVTKRQHFIESTGKDKAVVTFRNLPIYAVYHHKPLTAPFPKRSPVEPNAQDVSRLTEFVQRHISLLVARFNGGSVRVAFGDAQARIIV